MDFGQFINAFGTGYKQLKVSSNPNTGRINHLKKQHFCKMLLCAITKDESYVSNRSDTEYHSFYRNTDRRSLHPIAETMVARNDLDTVKFKSFLKQYYGVYEKEKLFQSFVKLNTNISLETLEDDITNVFVEILQEAAAKPDGRRKPPITDQATYTLECNANSLIEQIDDMLEGLIETGRKIASTQTVYGRLKLNLKPTLELWELLHRYLHRLKYLTASLHKLHSDERSTVRQLFRAVSCIEANDFVMSEAEYMLGTGNNSQVHNVEQSLSELKKDFQMQTDADRDIPVP